MFQTLFMMLLVALGFLLGGIQSESISAESPAPERAQPASTQKRAILVTGATTGIGRKTAELLAREGFHVYAGARKDSDMEALDAIENIQAIRLDVTVPEQIDAALQTVIEGGLGLFGLINNAGVAVVSPLTELPEQDLEFILDVNVKGPYRVTKAFAPLLLESGGRVSTTGSISGVLPWTLGGAYCMSKHAMEAYADVLASELEPRGVKVSIVEPGNYQSNITATLRQRLVQQGYSSEGSLYKEQMDAFLNRKQDRKQFKEADDVAQAFLQAMTAEHPKHRYMVVPNALEARMTLAAAMRRVVQLNHDQPFTLSRDELMELLDEILVQESSE